MLSWGWEQAKCVTGEEEVVVVVTGVVMFAEG